MCTHHFFVVVLPFPANFDKAEMFQLDFSNLAFGSECFLAPCYMLEGVHRVVAPILWDWVSGEEPHLFTIGLTQQAGMVMNFNSDVLEEGDLPA